MGRSCSRSGGCLRLRTDEGECSSNDGSTVGSFRFVIGVIKMRLLALALVLVAVLIVFRIYRAKPVPKPSDRPDPNVDMPQIADEAVQFAGTRGVTLDYTPDSVKQVEGILSDLHVERTKRLLSDSAVNQRAVQFGAYIGEVLRRTYGGSWSIDHSVGGPKSFPIHWKDHDSFPVGWCGKRIVNGDEDNVWFKFQVVTTADVKGNTGPMRRSARPTTAE